MQHQEMANLPGLMGQCKQQIDATMQKLARLRTLQPLALRCACFVVCVETCQQQIDAAVQKLARLCTLQPWLFGWRQGGVVGGVGRWAG